MKRHKSAHNDLGSIHLHRVCVNSSKLVTNVAFYISDASYLCNDQQASLLQTVAKGQHARVTVVHQHQQVGLPELGRRGSRLLQP